MKILRRLAMVFLILGLGCIAAGLFVRSRVHAVPTWYRHLQLDEATRQQAANSMNQKLLDTYGKANDAQAAATRAAFSNPTSAPAAIATTPITLELSEAEINSFLSSWDNTTHWRSRISKYVTEPEVILEDNELIIAGMVPDWNVLVSLHFEPELVNGKLFIHLRSVLAGTLPLPRSVIDNYLQKLDGFINPKLPELRENAEISPKGWANVDAVAVAMGELLTSALHDQPAEPVIMLPEIVKQREKRSLPVQIVGVSISEKTLKLNLRTMTPDEREALQEHLRGNAGTEVVSAK